MTTPADLIGHVLLGSYRVLSVLGQGAMGTVYEAEHSATGRRVAVKTLRPDIGAVPGGASRRLEREGTAAAALHHPNIIEVEALGALDDGRLFLVMELARGVVLGDVVAAGPLHPRRALVIIRQVLEAVGFAHRLGFIHRDLKPDNIMLVSMGAPGAEFERVKVLDFGLVKLIGAAAAFDAEKLTETGLTFGTPAYIAPEQALGRPVDGRNDLYSLGVTLFEMLTGRRPFVSRDNLGLLKMHVSVVPPTLRETAGELPWCTAQMEHVIVKALEKQPDDRFATAAEMIAAVDRAFLSIQDLPEP